MQYILASSFADEFAKIAGEVDPAAFQRFTSQLRPGDVVQFNAGASDIARKSVRQGLASKLISNPIRRLTGSKEHHTAMYTGVDPTTGEHMITHNYEQGGVSGIHSKPLKHFADSTEFSAYRPHGITPEKGQAAAQQALALANSPTAYSKRNLVAAGINQAAEKSPGVLRGALRRVAGRVAENCNPATGICSALPVKAYEPVLGRHEAMTTFSGRNVANPRLANIAATPASIASSQRMMHVGGYAPAAREGSFIGAAIKRVGEKALSGARRIAPIARAIV